MGVVGVDIMSCVVTEPWQYVLGAVVQKMGLTPMTPKNPIV